MGGMLLDLDAYRRAVKGSGVSLQVQSPEVKAAVTEHRLCRLAAQAAVGRVPLRDVLLSLRRAGLIVSFRLHDDVLVVKAQRTLSFMFETVDRQ
jgi:hypothetical protein